MTALLKYTIGFTNAHHKGRGVGDHFERFVIPIEWPADDEAKAKIILAEMRQWEKVKGTPACPVYAEIRNATVDITVGDPQRAFVDKIEFGNERFQVEMTKIWHRHLPDFKDKLKKDIMTIVRKIDSAICKYETGK